MLYRVVRKIALKASFLTPFEVLAPGALSEQAVAALVRKGALAPVAAPPLVVLPGWSHRGKRLAQLGIESVVDFLETEVSEVARHCGVSPGLVLRWKGEAIEWLTAPSPKCH